MISNCTLLREKGMIYWINHQTKKYLWNFGTAAAEVTVKQTKECSGMK